MAHPSCLGQQSQGSLSPAGCGGNPLRTWAVVVALSWTIGRDDLFSHGHLMTVFPPSPASFPFPPSSPPPLATLSTAFSFCLLSFSSHYTWNPPLGLSAEPSSLTPAPNSTGAPHCLMDRVPALQLLACHERPSRTLLALAVLCFSCSCLVRPLSSSLYA